MNRTVSALLFFALLACSSTAPQPRGSGEPSTGGDGGSGGDSGAGGTSTGGTGGGTSTGGTGGGLVADAAPPMDDAAPPEDLAADAEPTADLPAPPDDIGPRDTKAAPDRAADVVMMPPNSYDPCPPKGQPCVVLPLGDSLTQGANSTTSAGYRVELFRQIAMHGKSVNFVGSQASGPTMITGITTPFPRHHEGHGGFSIGTLQTWLTDNNTIATYKPDIVLLHIGTNNGLRHPGANIPSVLTALGGIIDQLVAADPRMLIIVAQIIPSTSADGVTQTAAYDAGIPAVVAARASAGKHVIVADLHTPFTADPNWKTDYFVATSNTTSDVHPIDAGYDVMGRAWYTTLGPLLH